METDREDRSVRGIRTILASLGLVGKEMRRIGSETRKGRLHRRVMELMKTFLLSKAALENIHQANNQDSTLSLDPSACVYCGCTCKAHPRVNPLSPDPAVSTVLDIRDLTRVFACGICGKATLSKETDSDQICEECKSGCGRTEEEGTISFFIKAELHTEPLTTASKPGLSPRRKPSKKPSPLDSRSPRLHSISPEPVWSSSTRTVKTRTEFAQTEKEENVVNLSIGNERTQWIGSGPFLCRVIIGESGTNAPFLSSSGHTRAVTSSPGRFPLIKKSVSTLSKPAKFVDLQTAMSDLMDTAETYHRDVDALVQEQVDLLEQSKQHLLLSGVADRIIERYLRVFHKVENALKPVLPRYVSVLELLIKGLVLVCEAMAASHNEVMETVEAKQSAERNAQIRMLMEQVTKLQGELVSVKVAAAAETQALKHTVNTYEQRMQTLYTAFKSSKAL